LNKSRLLGAVSACALSIFFSSAANAALVPRLSGQAFYDTELDITWLADANLQMSNTFGLTRSSTSIPAAGEIGLTGWMSWTTANSWITGMNADGGTGYLGFNDWHLPTLSPVDGSTFNTIVSNNGTTDIGYGATGIGWQDPTGNYVSEMGYMYYVNLGNWGRYIPNYGGSSTSFVEQPGWGLNNTGPFSNLQSGSNYWTGAEFDPNDAWVFNFDGSQGVNSKPSFNFAWAVHSGDVAAVPIPAAAWLFGSGLLGLIGVAGHKK
jgi:hypothetical protein